MKSQRRFAPTSGEFTPESVARFTGIGTGARLLGRDLSAILTPAVKNKVIEILNRETEEESQSRLIEDMLINKFDHNQTFEYMLKLLIELRSGLEE